MSLGRIAQSLGLHHDVENRVVSGVLGGKAQLWLDAGFKLQVQIAPGREMRHVLQEVRACPDSQRSLGSFTSLGWEHISPLMAVPNATWEHPVPGGYLYSQKRDHLTLVIHPATVRSPFEPECLAEFCGCFVRAATQRGRDLLFICPSCRSAALPCSPQPRELCENCADQDIPPGPAWMALQFVQRELEAELQEDPGNPVCLFALARCYEEREQWERAVHTCAQLLEIQPDHLEASDLQARLQDLLKLCAPGESPLPTQASWLTEGLSESPV